MQNLRRNENPLCPLTACMAILYYVLGQSPFLFVVKFSGSPDMCVQYTEMIGTDNHVYDGKKGISMIKKTSLHIFPIPWTKIWLVNADELIQDCSEYFRKRIFWAIFCLSKTDNSFPCIYK